jgi:hypothetical protein
MGFGKKDIVKNISSKALIKKSSPKSRKTEGGKERRRPVKEL